MKRTTSIITSIYIAALIAFIGYGYFLQEKSDIDIIQGTIDAPEIRISAKIPGRVSSVFVEEGQLVGAGDAIFSLESPELNAKRSQALALVEAKKSLRDRAERGARSEELQIASDNLVRAQNNAELAQKSLQRLENLFNDGLVSAQMLDEAKAQASSASFAQKSAQQQLQMAKKGTEQELKDAAESDLNAALGVLEEVDAALAETMVSTVKAGEVSSVLIHEGEISPAGFPVVSLINTKKAYVRFHLSENKLKGLSIGSTIGVTIPALDKTETMEIFYISAMGDYATWRATKPGEYDLKTFEVKARPNTFDTNWRVGMTAIIDVLKVSE
ncbi:HlyD family secretion protein [Reinekea sp.]|jgi:HlyD family secretion protein|uniref:HlyD family secretion protein n=1 Tax=Reinekea sp. TaxID=1970455 RepID=UPI003989672A